MPNRPAAFTQSDLTRALKAARDAGIPVGRFEICPKTGRIVVISAFERAAEAANPWDDAS